jgi:hypothetical protein
MESDMAVCLLGFLFFSYVSAVFIGPLHDHHRRAHGLSGLPNPAQTVIMQYRHYYIY